MMYHLAKYPIGHLSVWSTDEEWVGSIRFEKLILGEHPIGDRNREVSGFPGPASMPGQSAESTFFMSQFVIFSSENMNEIIEHATFAVLEEKVVAKGD